MKTRSMMLVSFPGVRKRFSLSIVLRNNDNIESVASNNTKVAPFVIGA